MSTTKILWIQQKSTYQLYFIWQCLDLPHAFPTPLSPLPPLILQDSWAWSPTHPSNWFRFDSWLDISQVTPEQPRRIVIALQPACRHCPSACSICKKIELFLFSSSFKLTIVFPMETLLLVRAIQHYIPVAIFFQTIDIWVFGLALSSLFNSRSNKFHVFLKLVDLRLNKIFSN